MFIVLKNVVFRISRFWLPFLHFKLFHIPFHYLQVLFTFRQQDQLVVDRSQTNVPAAEPAANKDTNTNTPQQQQDLEEIAGFIMVEAGLEDITLKAAKRFEYVSTFVFEDIQKAEHI